MAELQFPQDFSIEKAELITVNGQIFDIKFLIGELNIYEDLFSTSLSGDMVLVDAENRVMNWPLFGYETVNIRFQTPDFPPIDLSFYVSGVKDRGLIKEREQTYRLSLITPEALRNYTSEFVSKSYKGKLISSIAGDIQRTFLQSNFVRNHPTKFLHHYIIPNLNPFQAIWWLASRANSSTHNGASYVYYQDVDGFHFVPVELLLQGEPQIEYKWQAGNVRTDEKFPKRRTDEDFFSIQQYDIMGEADILDNLMKGMYGNRLITHNITTKRFNLRGNIDYLGSFPLFQHTDTSPNASQKGYGRVQGSDALLKYYPTGHPDFPNKVEDWLKQRTTQLQQYENIKLRIYVPGDSRRRVGEMIKFDLPSPEPTIEKTRVFDKYLRGNWLITSLRHKIETDSYTTIMEIMKDSVFTAYP